MEAIGSSNTVRKAVGSNAGVRLLVVIALAAALGFAFVALANNAPSVAPAALAAADGRLAADHLAFDRASGFETAAENASRFAAKADRTRLHNVYQAAKAASVKAGARLSESKKEAGDLHAAALAASSSPYFALFGAMSIVLLWLISSLCTGDWNPFVLAMGADNRLSTSKMQMLLWTGCVGFVYVMVYADRVITLGRVEPISSIPQNVAIALGLSVTSLVAAKVIATSGVSANSDNRDVAEAPSYDPAALVRNDGATTASLTKVQILFWTGVAIVTYLVTSFHELGTVAACSGGGCELPDIDTMLMAFMGLGHASYIGGKLSLGSTPSLSGVSSASDGDAVTVTLSGSNLGTGGAVYVNGSETDVSVKSWSATSITFTLPAQSTWSAGDKIALAVLVNGTLSPSIAYTYSVAGSGAQRSAPGGPAQTPDRTPRKTPVVPMEPSRPALPKDAPLRGIDVSWAQGTAIDWPTVNARGLARFAIARASYSIDPALDDPNFERNHDECKRLGINFGAYHFLVFWRSGVDQANYFLQRINGRRGTIRPCVDVEELSGDIGSVNERIAILSDFNTTIRTKLGVDPIIYTNQNTWNTLMGGSNAFSGHSLWVADFTGDPNRSPAMPAGFKDWTIYQYSENGALPLVGGGSKGVDLDVLQPGLAAITF